MDREFWERRWQENRIGFHQSEVNRFLQAHQDWFARRLDGAVLVPLCGKSRDMVWLQAHIGPVLGVELSTLAAEAFFREQNLVADDTERDRFRVRRASDLTVLVGNFFDLTSDLTGPVAAVYDRAALIALPPPMRRRYVAHMTKLLRPGTPVLLVAPFSSKDPLDGPPFAVSEDEVRDLYGEAFTIEILAQHRYTPEAGSQLGYSQAFREENVYGLIRT